jgi:RNA polymerase sigma factor (sigma-70 family)
MRTDRGVRTSGQDVDVRAQAIVGDPLLRPSPKQAGVGRVGGVEVLYREHRSRLVQLAAAVTLDRAEAEEVVQEAFAGLQQRFDEIDEPVRYLHRAVVNRAVSVLRRRRTAARYPVPVAAVTMNPEIDETWAAVCHLPRRERAAVVLRYWLDWPEADIASSLGWPAGTVKSTLHRALKRLEKELSR